MSKQRPYGTFEEAFYNELVTRHFEDFDELMLDITYFHYVNNQNRDITSMVLPWKYIFGTHGKNHIIVIFWQCLCYQWGECSSNITESYIPSKNLDMLIDDVVYSTHYIVVDMIINGKI